LEEQEQTDSKEKKGMLSDREKYIIVFLHSVNAEHTTDTSLEKLDSYCKILNIDINNDESLTLMKEIDHVLMDMIDLDKRYLQKLEEELVKKT
jgi:uncharacterized protein YjdB